MPVEEKKTTEDSSSKISRRDFLKDAGLIVGGATVGSMALINACGGGGTETVTLPGGTVTATKTVTSTAVSTTTVAGPGGSIVTVTQPGATVTKEVQTGGAEGVVTLNINGKDYTMKVEPEWTLAFVIRKKLALIGTKVPCDRGECGLCTVLVDDKPVLSCCIPAIEAEGMNIVTIEGLADGPNLHPVQQAYMDNCIFQCGYCTPAMILVTKALWDKSPNPTAMQAREAISGNLCWCGDQSRILGLITKNPVRARRGEF